VCLYSSAELELAEICASHPRSSLSLYPPQNSDLIISTDHCGASNCPLVAGIRIKVARLIYSVLNANLPQTEYLKALQNKVWTLTVRRQTIPPSHMRLSPVISALSLTLLLVEAQGDSHEPEHPRSDIIPPAEFSVPITAKVPRSKAKKRLLAGILGRLQNTRKGTPVGASATVPIAGAAFDREYVADVTVGGQTFSLIIDTGRFVNRCSCRLNADV
jgi:hypothetical protein